MNNNLKLFSNEQLLKELQDRRERFAAQQPIAIENPDFSTVIQLCKTIVDIASIGGGVSGDNETYVFQCTMKCIFGDDIFTWINANRK